jgi:hypothetical protein
MGVLRFIVQAPEFAPDIDIMLTAALSFFKDTTRIYFQKILVSRDLAFINSRENRQLLSSQQNSRVVFTALHFLRDLQIGPIR